MSLKCGIIGLPAVGKTTIFNCFSNNKAQISNFGNQKANIGMCFVPDNRLYELEKYQKTEKIVHTTIEFVDIPGLSRTGGKENKNANKFLEDIKNVDALVHIVRCFDDDNIPHLDGSINPVRDIETLNLELQIKDIDAIEKKIQRLQKLAKTGNKEIPKSLEILNKLKNSLEEFKNIRDIELEEYDKKEIEDLFLLTIKPVLHICNVDQNSIKNENKYVATVKEFLQNQNTELLVIAAKLEAEISELDENDKNEFLQDAGLNEPGVNKLVRVAYKLLDYQTFFTIGAKEIRAWTIKKGFSAPEAAGVIHSDLKRGFIRAEVIKYDDFMNFKSEQACKEHGKMNLNGKDYIVQDGDIMNILFNV